MAPKIEPRKPDRIEEPKIRPFANVSEASIQALAVTIAVLPQLLDILDDIAGALESSADADAVMKLYYLKKGKDEGLFTPDELDEIEKTNDQEPGENAKE